MYHLTIEYEPDVLVDTEQSQETLSVVPCDDHHVVVGDDRHVVGGDDHHVVGGDDRHVVDTNNDGDDDDGYL